MPGPGPNPSLGGKTLSGGPFELTPDTSRFPCTCQVPGRLALQTWGSFLPKTRWKGSAGAGAAFHQPPLISSSILCPACSPSAPPPVLNRAALGFRSAGKVALGTVESRVTRHSLYLYFKQALTGRRPRVWQVLFSRSSEAGRRTLTAPQGKAHSRECTKCSTIWGTCESFSLKVGNHTNGTTADCTSDEDGVSLGLAVGGCE